MKPNHFIFRALVVGLVTGLITGPLALPEASAQGRNNQLVVELLSRIEQLEREIRQLRGDLERNQYQQSDMLRRLESLENRSGAAGPPSDRATASAPRVRTPVVITSSPEDERSAQTDSGVIVYDPPARRARPVSSREQAAFDEAFRNLQEGRYPEAAGGFEGFLNRHPDSQLAPDAYYWLGETHYTVRDFARARDAFVALGVNHPDSDKLPDALLKLGYVYDALGDKTKARRVLEKLMQTYPDSQAASLGQARLNMLRR